MKKSNLSIRTTLLTIIGVLNILIAVLVGKDVFQSGLNLQQARALRQGSHVINALYDANKNISLERAASLSLIYIPHETVTFVRGDLAQNRADADMALGIALPILKKIPFLQSNVKKINDKYADLQKLRVRLDSAMKEASQKRDLKLAGDVFDTSTALINKSQNLILLYSKSWQSNDAAISREMMFKYFVWELAEFIGEQYAIVGQIIAENKRLHPSQQQQLMSMDGRIQYGWDILHKYAMRDTVAHKLLPYTEEAQTQYFLTFDQIKDFFYNPAPGQSASYPVTAEMWLGMASQTVDSLLSLQTEVLKAVQHRIDLIEQKSGKEMLISAIVFLCAIGLSLYCWSIIVFRITGPINAMVNALYKATRQETYEMPKISHKHDEIGKLADVLEAFQDNARKMKQSNEELERFAYIAAHDLKSPLRAVDNISQWLEEDLESCLQDQDRKYMNELRNRVRLMDKMLDDTLEYARIGAKMNAKDNELVNGRVLVEDITALLAPPKEFCIRIGDGLSHIHIQRQPLQQVLFNLVNNALKHHHKQNGLIEINVEVSKISYVFTVRDDGPGIASRHHQKIFEMFQTLQSREKSRGRGMGLAVVRKIITSQGGKIEIESQPGKGALFRFTWPKLQTETAGENNDFIRRQYA